MGRTEEEIMMYEKATEIQEEWEPDVGDVIADPKEKWFNMYLELADIFYEDGGKKSKKQIQKERSGAIWLPHQNQLQKMIDITKYSFEICLCALPYKFEWFVDPLKHYGCNGDSMEQFWLAFVMKEKYGKVWDRNRKNWVKGEQERVD